jgi:plasmid maintenance system antidote protein VapI
MQLNIEKILGELKRTGKNKGWLARQLGVSNATVTYILKSKHITHADRVAKVFGLNPRDLIE